MGIELTSIGSSSSGNSYIIRGGETVVILDVGLSGKKIKAGLAELELRTCDVDAILVTHEHVDHIKSIRMMARECRQARIITSEGTYNACDSMKDIDGGRLTFVSGGESLTVGELGIRTFKLSHDAAEPVGFALEYEDDRLVVVTDTGIVTEEIRKEIMRANKIVFESNYEENLLLMGPYPYNVKRRILGDFGHLSNEIAGNMLSEMVQRQKEEAELLKAPRIMLAHISTTNNTAGQARYTMESIMKKHGHNSGADYDMIIAAKEGITRL